MPDDIRDTDELRSLVIRRGQLKATLTRFSNYVKGANIDITALKIRLSKLEPTWNEFEQVQSRIEALDVSQVSERESFEEDYFEAVTDASKIIETHQNSLINSCSNQAGPNSPIQSVPNSNLVSSSARLQAITLPKFNGSYEGWLQFFETFQALVHNNSELSTIQKFYYLQSCLSQEAGQILQSLEICEANYQQAIELLKDRYENKRLLIHNHLRNLFDMTPVTKETPDALRKLIDHLMRNVRALSSLGQPVEHWDTLLIYMVMQKLDTNTKKEWEVTNKKDCPKFNEFLDFLKNKCLVLETIVTKQQPYCDRSTNYRRQLSHLNLNKQNISLVNQNMKSDSLESPQNVNCYFCKQIGHYTYKCFKLLSFSSKDRFFELKKAGLCTNCLKAGHSAEVCNGKCCKICNRKHNSMLHDFNQNQRSNTNTSGCNLATLQGDPEAHLIMPFERGVGCQEQLNQPTSDTANVNLPSLNACAYENYGKSGDKQFYCKPQILLATAIVHILDSDNRWTKCRALLDSASQSNFCSVNLLKKLNLKSESVNIPVIGINHSSCNILAKVKTPIKSLDNSFYSKIDCLVVENITNKLPQISFDVSLLNLPNNIQLADPTLGESAEVDLLLGTEVFFSSLGSEKIDLGPKRPILQNTKFGWVLAGPLGFYDKHVNHNNKKTSCFLTVNPLPESSLHDVVQRFWQIENIPVEHTKFSKEELDCELHFRRNVEVDSSGRYIVKLPLKENVSKLGQSYEIAKKCLGSLERRLHKNPNLKSKYSDFLSEYEQLGHMSKIDPYHDKPDELCVYFSHHAVLRESSSTTKLRVVFNASLKTSTGLSLNDVLMVGPRVQPDIFDIVLRMRTYPILVIADIEKMYRMVLVHESQRNLQRILVWDSASNDVSHYQLNTLTYGTACASFLATRVLHEIGLKLKNSDPEVSNIIINNFYMDDLIFGHHDFEHLSKLRQKIDSALLKSGFKLRKWLSNDCRITEAMPGSLPSDQFYLRDDSDSKTLGIVWRPLSDTISYDFKLNFDVSLITKRNILATIGQLFDVLGLVSPVIVKAKLILQSVWKIKLDWDQPVPDQLAQEWISFVAKLSVLHQLQIPRCIFSSTSDSDKVSLCGFSDASEKAFGACLYVIAEDQNGVILSRLLCSKSRLAPLSSLSLPRLELCGALLLAQLINKVVSCSKYNFHDITLFTDSSIVLNWLNAEPNKWKMFVANRVAEIQRLTEAFEWRHIDSSSNPADVVSRGTDPEELQNISLWWSGPEFLVRAKSEWPNNQVVAIEVPEARKEKINLSFCTSVNPVIMLQIFKWSSYAKTIRIYSYVLRFVNNCRSSNRVKGFLTKKDLDETTSILCKLVQAECFKVEITDLKTQRPISSGSKLLSLNPFLDPKGLLRVGGRLNNSKLPYERKHPVILPSKIFFTELIIRHYHHKFLHAGPQFLLSEIRNEFWIMNGRQEIRRILHKCLTCFRVKPREINQLMGDLPESRVVPSRPFSSVGLDYGGPYLLKDGKTRNRILIKAYICIFICFCTKAVHAELVTDLSTDGFMNAFKRFSSRRGLPVHIFSDNATNFIGANHEISKLCQVVKTTSNSDKYRDYFSENNINWHFIPARSPHYGGIWESAVRSFKFHLKRVLGDNNLNFEHFYTLLNQIEAILNSRPICPMSGDPSDMEILTPAHFLIGGSLVAVPQDNVLNVSANRLCHYKQLQQVLQRFWALWSRDYLNTLQQRAKWRKSQENIKVGAMVLLKEDNEPPMRWPLGRVEEVYHGRDGRVRVVSVRTRSSVLKRSVQKLCPLPLDS